MHRISLLMVFCAPAFFASPSSAATIYVNDSATAGANNGTSWSNAFTDLHDGLKAAQSGDEVRIGQGIYKPAAAGGDRTISFQLPSGVVVQGGYAGAGAANPDSNDPDEFETILSGDLNDNDGKPGSWFAYEENSYHVVTAIGTAAGTELRGVIVRAGNAMDPSYEVPEDHGGGIWMISGTLALAQCTIEDNQCLENGGGVNATGPLLATDCIIRRNRQLHSVRSGGGIFAGAGSSFTDCVFQDNSAAEASAAGGLFLASGTVDSCTFIGNLASEQGGAIAAQGTIDISNTQFASNNAGGEGGAIAIFSGTITITECAFFENSCGGGGAISAFVGASLEIRDCDFEDNFASIGGAINNFGQTAIMRTRFKGNSLPHGFGEGGAIANSGELDLVNCVFHANSSQTFGGGVISNYGSVHAVNCRFTKNAVEEIGAVLLNNEIATLTNCTIAANRTRVGSTVNDSGALHNRFDGQLIVNNCIVWGNETADGQTGETAQIWNDPGGSLTINNSCVEGWTGAYGGVENSGFDPMLVDDQDNFRLAEGSPAINHGNNAWLPVDEHDVDEDGDTAETIPLDLDLHARIANGTVDAGAYEFQGDSTGCAADVAPKGGNGTVDVDDLLVVINNWGNAGPEGDINSDQTVDVDDLLAVINAWGACE